jgi:hypothetical protein
MLGEFARGVCTNEKVPMTQHGHALYTCLRVVQRNSMDVLFGLRPWDDSPCFPRGNVSFSKGGG